MPPRYRMVVTSNRYDVAEEQEWLAEVHDLDIELDATLCRGEDDLIAAGSEADVLLCSTRDAITRRVLDHLPRLKVVASYGVGLNHLDLDAATERGIVVTHYPAYCTAEVADHALALILALNRRIVELDRDLHAGAWNAEGAHTRRILRGPVCPLRELTLGIVGIGRIGSAVAQRAKAFGLTLLAADPYVAPAELVARGAEPVALDELLTRADIVTLHCPLTPETRGMIDARALGLMPPSAVLVNTARGPIVDLDALVAALTAGALAGAALDVVDPEPLPPGSPLYALPNVILTPHAAYYSERSVETLRRETLRAALAVLRGERPPVVANPAVLQRVRLVPPRVG